jgi:hypothetical protein
MAVDRARERQSCLAGQPARCGGGGATQSRRIASAPAPQARLGCATGCAEPRLGRNVPADGGVEARERQAGPETTSAS